ncbi:MAG: hypothetical protein K0R25_366 [Rickettsiaceae bacterium]|jgi:hypothetical protein|nr:hypothetical protein [Rickettsiaceae bacterium]
MKQFFKNFAAEFKHHFILAHHGREDIAIAIWVWGGVAYLISFFINKFLLLVNVPVIQWIFSILVIAYFVWHIVVIKRCTPKKIPLTEEQKAELKKTRGKRFVAKLLLKEPFTKSDSSLIAIVIDIYVITCFLSYLL